MPKEPQSPPSKAERIRLLNDQLRTTLSGGQIMLSAGVQALTEAEKTEVMTAVVLFDDFSPDNDPYNEHDFGLVVAGTNRIFWKIDYYDTNHRYASPDPSEPKITRRVLTIMLAEEY